MRAARAAAPSAAAGHARAAAVPGRRHHAARPDEARRDAPGHAGRRERAAPAARACRRGRRRRPQARRLRQHGRGGRAPRRAAATTRSIADSAAPRRQRAAAPDGHAGRQRPAAHALPLLPRRALGRLQQAPARLGLLGAGGHEPPARGARHQRGLHRAPIRATSRRRWSRSTPRWRSTAPADGAACAVRAAAPRAGRHAAGRDRARARRADHRLRGAGRRVDAALALPEGPRPRVLPVRAGLGGRRARPAAGHGARGAHRARRRGDAAVARARGRARAGRPRARRGAPPRRAAQAAFAEARPRGHNAFKVALGARRWCARCSRRRGCRPEAAPTRTVSRRARRRRLCTPGERSPASSTASRLRHPTRPRPAAHSTGGSDARRRPLTAGQHGRPGAAHRRARQGDRRRALPGRRAGAAPGLRRLRDQRHRARPRHAARHRRRARGAGRAGHPDRTRTRAT